MPESISLRFDFDDKDLSPFFKGVKESTEILDNALQLSAFEIRNIIVKKISQGVRSGRIYKRPNISHQAAAPGEPPKTDTGRLVGSIRTDFGYLTADIGSDVVYAIFQEMGTSKMPAHPYLQPSLEEAKPEIGHIFDKALKQVMGIL